MLVLGDSRELGSAVLYPKGNESCESIICKGKKCKVCQYIYKTYLLTSLVGAGEGGSVGRAVGSSVVGAFVGLAVEGGLVGGGVGCVCMCMCLIYRIVCTKIDMYELVLQ